MMTSLFKTIDCHMLFVTSIEDGLGVYEKTLGHKLLWQSDTMAGLEMSDTKTQLVLTTDTPSETIFLTEDTHKAYLLLLKNNFKSIKAPFKIRVGSMAEVMDPWGNVIKFLDLSDKN